MLTIKKRRHPLEKILLPLGIFALGFVGSYSILDSMHSGGAEPVRVAQVGAVEQKGSSASDHQAAGQSTTDAAKPAGPVTAANQPASSTSTVRLASAHSQPTPPKTSPQRAPEEAPQSSQSPQKNEAFSPLKDLLSCSLLNSLLEPEC